MNEEELKAFYDAKIERVQRELEEFDRKQVERRRREHPEDFSQADLPVYSRPWELRRRDNIPCKPEEHIRQTAKRRAFANWLWCALLCYAWILAAMYYRYSR